jgi:hypothetical protein
MHLKKFALTAALLAPLALGTTGVMAGEEHDHDHDPQHDDEHRQHGAHVHGVAGLNLALEGNEVHVELDSPAANIVGFEHAPSSEADHAALDQAVATLRGGDRLFQFNSEAGCRMEKADVISALLDDGHHEHADDHGHEKKDHDDHGHENKEKHAHDEHKHDDQGHDGHGHEKHADETHSDIDAVYHFECDNPGKLTQLTVELFEAFPGMEELNVQYVIESKQGAAELNAASHVVTF